MKLSSLFISPTQKDPDISKIGGNSSIIYLLNRVLKFATSTRVYKILTDASLTSDLADVSKERPLNDSILVYEQSSGTYVPTNKNLLFGADILEIDNGYEDGEIFTLTKNTIVRIYTRKSFGFNGTAVPLNGVISFEPMYLSSNSLEEHTFMLDGQEITLSNGYGKKQGTKYITELIATKTGINFWMLSFNEKIVGYQSKNPDTWINYGDIVARDQATSAVNLANAAGAAAMNAGIEATKAISVANTAVSTVNIAVSSANAAVLAANNFQASLNSVKAQDAFTNVTIADAKAESTEVFIISSNSQITSINNEPFENSVAITYQVPAVTSSLYIKSDKLPVGSVVNVSLKATVCQVGAKYSRNVYFDNKLYIISINDGTGSGISKVTATQVSKGVFSFYLTKYNNALNNSCSDIIIGYE